MVDELAQKMFAVVEAKSEKISNDNERVKVFRIERAEAQQDMIRAVRRYAWDLYESNRPLPASVIRDLYWGHPDLSAIAIAQAFGMQVNDPIFRQIVGSSPEEEVICFRCNNVYTVKFDSRDQKRRDLPRLRRPPRPRWLPNSFLRSEICPSCVSDHREEQNRAAERCARQARAEEVERQEMRERAEREGRFRLRIEYEGVDY